LYQCLTKSAKFDFIVQKAVELGVSEIIPVLSARCVSRPNDKAMYAKIERWNKIALEAMKQCGRARLTNVRGLSTFEQVIRGCSKGDLSILFYECGGSRLNETAKLSENREQWLNILIGSEGGFEVREVDSAREQGWISATLGKRVLRVETASIAALSVIMNLNGEI
jgi:16S rRNA (uracil1498-N3)-methyltransferase